MHFLQGKEKVVTDLQERKGEGGHWNSRINYIRNTTFSWYISCWKMQWSWKLLDNSPEWIWFQYTNKGCFKSLSESVWLNWLTWSHLFGVCHWHYSKLWKKHEVIRFVTTSEINKYLEVIEWHLKKNPELKRAQLTQVRGILRSPNVLVTGRNEVVAKVIFLHLSVIYSVHRGGLPQCMLGYPPGADPPGADTPLGADPPRSRHTPPRSKHPPPGSRPPLGSRLQHMVYERPVRILLECILVNSKFKWLVAKYNT